MLAHGDTLTKLDDGTHGFSQGGQFVKSKRKLAKLVVWSMICLDLRRLGRGQDFEPHTEPMSVECDVEQAVAEGHRRGTLTRNYEFDGLNRRTRAQI
jgi:hypothetical protein